jgi:hypothetical protein
MAMVTVMGLGLGKGKALPTATPMLMPTDQQIRAPSSSPVQHRHNNRAASSPPEANWVYQIHSQ